MDLLSALNELEELIENSGRVPLTRKVMVNEDSILDLLDRIRTTIPEEIRQAKWIIQEREKVMSESQKEARRIVENAQKQVEKQAEDSEVVRKAKAVAEEIIARAERTAQEMREGAREYADEILSALQDKLNKINQQIEQGRSELRAMK
ncbi:MAG TPA: ATPase [Bacillota bacterium]|nr:ATPase [Peptococcaceae bacterium MAG4]NLW37448.1 ATP synthase F0 subunit B [Peptococcaceae bacterium]HPU35597.1 ATPase [Bacillota bacterium]HPZ43446.1 ATPase [Bacillota bacterium]HQD76452.1 ATPase [Bacillota bacterium]